MIKNAIMTDRLAVAAGWIYDTRGGNRVFGKSED